MDLAAGHQSRPHEDLEIAIPDARFDEVAAALAGCTPFVPDDGVLHPWADDLGSRRRSHQTWFAESGRWRVDVMREPSATAADGTPLWVCRRDETLRLPYGSVIRFDGAGVPYLRPELVLLFKAKAMRPKDDDDLIRALPRLAEADRAELARLLVRVHGREHPWLARVLPR